MGSSGVEEREEEERGGEEKMKRRFEWCSMVSCALWLAEKGEMEEMEENMEYIVQ